MKSFKLVLIITFIFISLKVDGQISVMSFNIRYNNPDDKENWWEYRKEDIGKMIKYYQPDILGIQEGLKNQVNFLDSSLSDYKFVGVGRDNGIDQGEYAAIFYNTEKIEFIDTKTFWLSETPDLVSVGWDASLGRIVTYGAFKDRMSNDTIFVFNCHYDHLGKLARQKSSELILNIIQNMYIETERIIVMGDFNCEPNRKPIKILKTIFDDSYEISFRTPYGPIGTFNQFDPAKEITLRIDYIFTRNLNVEIYITIDDRRKNNLLLSDRLPILVKTK